MAIISFMNMKGGVGKTTLCVNIADALATYHNKKVLVIDMDPQFNASQYILRVKYGDNQVKKYEEYKDQKKTIYSIFNAPDLIKDTQIDKTESEAESLFHSHNIDESHLSVDYTVNIKNNFDLLLGDIELLNLEISRKSGTENVLSRYLDIAQLRSKYEYILIDSPPTYSVFFISSYLACDSYLIPVKPDYLSSTGIALLKKAEESILKTYAIKKVAMGIVFTLIDPRNNLHEPVIRNMRNTIGRKHIFSHEMKYYQDIPKGLSEDSRKFMLDIFNNNINNTIKQISEEFISKVII